MTEREKEYRKRLGKGCYFMVNIKVEKEIRLDSNLPIIIEG